MVVTRFFPAVALTLVAGLLLGLSGCAEQSVAQIVEAASAPAIASEQPPGQTPAEQSGPPVAAALQDGDRTVPPTWLAVEVGLADDGVFRSRDVIGPYTTVQECRQQQPALEDRLILAYVDQYAESSMGLAPRDSWLADVPPEVKRAVAFRSWSEQREFTVGPMWQLHVQAEFDRDAQNAVAIAIRQSVVQQRVFFAGGIAGLVLAAMGVVYSGLKVDTWTRGYYSRGLTLAGGIALATLGAAGVALNKAFN